MIRQLIIWFFLSCKRVLKRPFLLFVFFLLPLGALAFRQAEERDSGKIAIALYTDGDAWNEQAAKVLMEGDGAFSFYLCETEEELEADVMTGRAECGYSFPADFRERLKQQDYRRSIRVTVSPSTVTADLAAETVFAGFFRIYGRELLEQYIKKGDAFESVRESSQNSPEELWEQIELRYEEALRDGSTFAFEYETAEGGSLQDSGMKAAFPVRGIGAVFLFVMGLAAAVTAAEDRDRGFYQVMPVGTGRAFQMVSISAMVCMASVPVFASLLISGEGKGIWRELVLLVLYGAAVIVYASGLLYLVKHALFLSGLIPFFILGSLVACPVFADLSVFVPVISVIRKLFLPWYYLRL